MMKKFRFGLLVGAVSLGLITPAYSLTITATFDTSITSATNAAAIEGAINFALKTLQSNIVDNVAVSILFVSDESVGLGQSQTLGEDVDYAAFITALRSHAASLTDTNALKRLTNNTQDPVIGKTTIHLTTAQARVLGIDTTPLDPGLYDSTVSCKMSLMNFNRTSIDPNKYDFIGTVEHEVNEVLGISSGLPSSTNVWPVDLFRYTTNLARTFITTGDNAYFSTDGTNLVARYNMDAGGDLGDWWSVHDTNRWSPAGIGTKTQVQDAYGNPGVYDDLGVSELTALDVVGWTLAVAAPVVSPKITMVRSGTNKFTLSWTNSASFVLQESTNVSKSWITSATGTTNPAVIIASKTNKFYRLFHAAGSSFAPEAAVTTKVQPSKSITRYSVTRALHPR